MGNVVVRTGWHQQKERSGKKEKMDMRANIGICGHFDWHMTGFIVLYHYFLVVNQPDSTDSACAEQRMQWGEP